MSKPVTRWTDGSMDDRVRRRYVSERRFRAAGFLAVAVSALFLALLLGNMMWKGLGGFTRTEASVTIDFAKSDLMIDPAALTGGQAQEVLGSANLDGVLSAAATAALWPRSRGIVRRREQPRAGPRADQGSDLAQPQRDLVASGRKQGRCRL